MMIDQRDIATLEDDDVRLLAVKIRELADTDGRFSLFFGELAFGLVRSLRERHRALALLDADLETDGEGCLVEDWDGVS